jgi:hypothetical protein
MDTSFTVTANCFPPKGKKLSSHSIVRLWEKINSKWILADQISPNEDQETFANLGIFANYVMSKTVNVVMKNSELALEIDFIHCNKTGGGQCTMERYIGKIARTENAKDDQLIFDLRI